MLDIAMRRIGIMDLRPGKGYHFPEGAYVEYIGVMEADRREPAKKELTEACNNIISEAPEDHKTFVEIMEYEEAAKALRDGVPSYMPEGKPFRVVKITEEDGGCPCGGTHIKSVKDIQSIEVTKIQKKGKNTRVSYTTK